MDSQRPPLIALMAHQVAVAEPTGIARYVTELTTALAEATSLGDASVHYQLSAPTEPDEPTWIPPGVRWRRIDGSRRSRTLATSAIWRPRYDRVLGHPDLVHSLYPWAPIPSRAPSIVTVHDLIPLAHPDWYRRREAWMFQRAIDHARKHASRVICVSAYVAGQVEALGFERDRVWVVHSGVSQELHGAHDLSPEHRRAVCARLGISPDRFLLAVGTVSERKNVTTVLRALPLLGADTRRRLRHLVIAGPDGIGADLVHREIERLRLTDRVKVAGFVAPQDLRVLLGEAFALVHPSREEGFGFTPLEAMASGTAVVTSNAASLPEVVGDAGILVDPSDPAAWAAALDRLVGDDEARERLVAQGKARAATFTWRRTAEEVAAVHREVLGTAWDG